MSNLEVGAAEVRWKVSVYQQHRCLQFCVEVTLCVVEARFLFDFNSFRACFE